MAKKKASGAENAPILRYTSLSERTIKLPDGVMETFTEYSKFFQEKAGYELSPGDVIAAKSNVLFTHPENLCVPETKEEKNEKLLLPNSSWAGIDHAASYHKSSPEKVLESLATSLCADENFVRWQKKNKKILKREKIH